MTNPTGRREEIALKTLKSLPGKQEGDAFGAAPSHQIQDERG